MSLPNDRQAAERRRKFIEERMPAVMRASRALQSMVNISSGSRMLKNELFTSWQMPDLPTLPAQSVQSVVSYKMNLAEQAAQGLRGRKRMHSPVADLETAKSIIPTLFQIQGMPYATGSVVSQSQSTIRPASPLPQWHGIPEDEDSKDCPAYWTPELSGLYTKWLKLPDTKSREVSLTKIELRNVSGEVCTTILAEEFERLTIVRLTLPRSMQKPLDPPQLLEWVLLDVRCKVIERKAKSNQGGDEPMYFQEGEAEEELEDENTENVAPKYNQPYVLIAFPIQAITESNSCTVQKGEKTEHGRELLLGTKQKAPLVHARGRADKKFADEFIEACVRGEGIVEVRSEEKIELP